MIRKDPLEIAPRTRPRDATRPPADPGGREGGDEPDHVEPSSDAATHPDGYRDPPPGAGTPTRKTRLATFTFAALSVVAAICGA